MFGKAKVDNNTYGSVQEAREVLVFPTAAHYTAALSRLMMKPDLVPMFVSGEAEFAIHTTKEGDTWLAHAIHENLIPWEGIMGREFRNYTYFFYKTTFTDQRDVREAVFSLLTSVPTNMIVKQSFGIMPDGFGKFTLFGGYSEAVHFAKFAKGRA